MTTRPAGEWFDAIGEWTAVQRRVAAAAACAFVAVTLAAIVPWLVAGPAPAGATAPMPQWNGRRFLDGELMRAFERHAKESAWVTHALRSAHDGVLHVLGVAPPPLMRGQFHYELENGDVLDAAGMLAAMQRGFLVWLPDAPRPRPMVAANQTFYLAYSDHELLRRPWFDEKGRVRVAMNRFAMRDRADLQEQKTPGERRVLCLGDSITMAWGVPEEFGWPRRLEASLRETRPSLQVVNAGAAGTICVDEYCHGLTKRWPAFEPDAVVVATSLNDLVPSNGLAVFVPAEGGPTIAGAPRTFVPRDALDLDPSVDWIAWLRSFGSADGEAAGLYGFDRPYEAMWDRGSPQKSLLTMRDWCRERKVPFVVALWPFLQGLGPGRTYVFGAIHAEVAAFCKANDIPFVDLLPVLRDIPQEDLWVTPADMHPNPRGHHLAARAIHEVLAPLLRD